MLDAIYNADKWLLLLINGLHTPFLDGLMWFFSDKSFAAFVYLAAAYLLVRHFGKKAWLYIIIGILLYGATDQLSYWTKNGTKRERPTHNPTISAQLHTVNDYKGGQYGFFSAHAANSFGMALFLLLLLNRKVKYTAAILLTYASLTSLSRVYLGVHYPTDVLVGAAVGSFMGWLFYLGLKRAKQT